MTQDGNPVVIAPEKHTVFAKDKFLRARIEPEKTHSIVVWAGLYFEIHVAGAPEKTQQAKKRDLGRFLEFYTRETGHDQIDGWTRPCPGIFKIS